MNLSQKLQRAMKTYTPTRVLGALRRRRADWLRKLQYRPQDTKSLRNAILFESFQGKVIGDNPLDIFLEVRARKAFPHESEDKRYARVFYKRFFEEV